MKKKPTLKWSKKKLMWVRCPCCEKVFAPTSLILRMPQDKKDDFRAVKEKV